MAAPHGPSYRDDADFHDAMVGYLGKLDPCDITFANGEPIWNNDDYSFLEEKCPEATANPSLWRQSQLCAIQGIFKITDHPTKNIYQVRGLDLSNITFVEGKDGIIVIDPLVSKECVEKALDLYKKLVPGIRSVRVTGLIYTHSHIDHYGGAEGVLKFVHEGDKIPIIAPKGFLSSAVSENVYAGNAMIRRAGYMYGDQLPKGPTGQIGAGLGQTNSTGSTTILAPNDIVVEGPDLHRVIDDVTIEFQLTPGTEAPAEMNFFFPEQNALCMAENVTHTMHNIQTLRGALVRDARLWSRYLDESITLYAEKSEVMFSSHHWPTWGKDKIHQIMTRQRDMYQYLHDQTLRRLNEGEIGTEIAEDFKLPKTLARSWYSQGYYGSISHNVKGIYHRYMGWYDGNPAHLWLYPPSESGKRYVECMGGPGPVIALAKTYEENKKDLRFAATLLSDVVFGYPGHRDAELALANVLEKLGWGAECGPWRNIYLTGAFELRDGIHGPTVKQDIFQSMMALELGQLMESMGIRLDGPKTPDRRFFTIDWYVSNVGPRKENQQVRLTLSNSALTNREIERQEPPEEPPQNGHHDSEHHKPTPHKAASADTATLSVWLTHEELVGLVVEPDTTVRHLTHEGDPKVWPELKGWLTTPDPDFAIVTPYKPIPLHHRHH